MRCARCCRNGNASRASAGRAIARRSTFDSLRTIASAATRAWEVIILPKQLRNPATYLLEVVRQVYYIATSRAVVLDSYCIVVGLLHDRIRVPVIQIWHSLGNMKRFGYTGLRHRRGALRGDGAPDAHA